MTDRETFNRFCAAKYPSLLSYARVCLRGSDAAWAEDVVQDVLFAVWQRRFFIFGDASGMQAYLLRSVFNRCMNYLGRKKTRQAYEEAEKTFAEISQTYYDPDNNPVIRYLFDSDLRETLDKAIAALPAKMQECFRLSYLDGYSHAEIASRLGIAERTVDAHIYAALTKLRASLKGV